MSDNGRETILEEVVTIIGGRVVQIRALGDGRRMTWVYDRGEAGGFLLPAFSRTDETMIEWGKHPVWESSDIQAQARQIANRGHWGRKVIDEADVDAWAVGAHIRAARNEADAWSDFLSTAGSAEAEARAEEEREADEARADAEAE